MRTEETGILKQIGAERRISIICQSTLHLQRTEQPKRGVNMTKFLEWREDECVIVGRTTVLKDLQQEK
jgi:hypothetical protein